MGGPTQCRTRARLTPPIAFVVELSVDKWRHVLEVFLGFIEGCFQSAHLLKLVLAPTALIGEHESAESILECIRDRG